MNTKESFINSNTNERPLKRILTNPLKNLVPFADVAIEIVQSVSNVSFVMVAQPKPDKEPQRQPIGFYSESAEPI
jgi:hypothetical protein